MLPEIISYLLTLRYPDSESGRSDFVCYSGFLQVRVPLIPAGRTIRYSVRPTGGVFAWIGYRRVIGTDMVPDVFSSTYFQYGAAPFSGILTQVSRDIDNSGFLFITEREPTIISITNISPLAQRGEMQGYFLVLTSPNDLAIVTDAIRRMHTSAVSEQLLQQSVSLLGVLADRPVEPKPELGGG